MFGRKAVHALELFGVKTAKFAPLDAVGPGLVLALAGGTGLADDVLEAGDGRAAFGGDDGSARAVDAIGEGQAAFLVAVGEAVGGKGVTVYLEGLAGDDDLGRMRP